jgi:hypothetical protein
MAWVIQSSLGSHAEGAEGLAVNWILLPCALDLEITSKAAP